VSARLPPLSEAMTNLFAKFRRRWPVVVVAVVVFTAVGLATLPPAHASGPKGQKGYRAQVILGSTDQATAAAATSAANAAGTAGASKSSTSSTTKAGGTDVNKTSSGYLALATNPAVAEAAAKALGPKTSAKKLSQQVTFGANNLGEILVRAKDQSATKSAAVALAFAKALISAAVTAQQNTQASAVARLNKDLTTLAAHIRLLQAHAPKGTTATTTTTTVPKHGAKKTSATTPSSATTVQGSTDLVTQAEINTSVQDYSTLYRELLVTQQHASSKPPLEVISIKKPVLVGASASKPIRRRYWAAGGFGIGLLLGLITAAALALLDRSVTDETKAEALFGLPVLAYVPAHPQSSAGRPPVVVSHPVSAVAEAYRRLTSALEQLPTHAVDPVAAVARPVLDGREADSGSRRADGTRQILGLVGARRRAGCTTVLANLSAALAERDFEPLAVDANLRRPRLHAVLGVDRVPGVTDGMTPTNAKPSPAVPRVRVIPAGSPAPNPPRDLHKIAAALPGWRRSAGVILVDIADLANTNDAAALAGELDALVVVCARPSATPRRIQRVLRDLGRSGAPVLGVVLVEVRTSYLQRLTAPRTPPQPSHRRRSRKSGSGTPPTAGAVAGAADGRPLPDPARIGSAVPRGGQDVGARTVSGDVGDVGRTPG
jgi:Mrp family chromosome partitioning ATPase/capsular polysaccharide biosynthesis protein